MSLLNEVRNGEIALPDLQRDFVWGDDQVRALLDSIMRGYPFGLLLFWETQFLEVVYRDFVTDYQKGQTYATKEKPRGRKMRMVLDGQQRLQSLYLALFGTYDGRRLYFNVTSGPKGKLATEESEQTSGRDYRFEFWRDDAENRPKRFIRVADIVRWPPQQENSEISKVIAAIGLTGEDAELARDNIKLLRTVMLTDLLPVETIDENVYEADQAMPIEEILEIFVRVNQGGTKLTRSDLMFSLIKTKWREARDKFDVVLAEVNRVGALDIDKDFIIRGLLTVSDVPTEFSVEVVERHWEKMEPKFPALVQAIKSAIDFSRAADVRFNAAKLLRVNALLPVIYFLSRLPNGSVPDDQRKPLRTFLYFLLFNDFVSAKSPHARVRYLREIFQRSPVKEVPLDVLLAEIPRRQKHALTSTTVELLNWNKALALNIAQPIAARDTLSWQEEPQIDHIFPQSKYRPIYGDLVDDIGNLAYLGRLRNIRKNDGAPWDYWNEASDVELRDDFVIEDRSLLSHENFPEFVERRRVALVDRVSAFLGR